MVYISPSVIFSALAMFGVCFGAPLSNNEECSDETGTVSTITNTITKDGTTTVTTFTTTVAAASSAAAPSTFPSDAPNAGLCQGVLKRHDTLVLWNGMPNRTDTAGSSFTNWPWLEEVAASTNALLGLVKVNTVSGTNEQNDILADEYIPDVIFGASEEMFTRDPHAFNDPEAVKSGKYRPKLRVNTEGKGAVSLNLFPLSEKGVLRVCVTFDLSKKDGDEDGPIWWKALHAAFDHKDVKLRLKENAWYPETFVSKNQFTTMAMLEMLTGYKTEYVFRNWGGKYPVVQPSGKGDASEYEQDLTSDSKYPAYEDWMLGPEHTMPTPNWNPTIIFSRDSGLRALNPVPNDPPGESFKHVYLQDSRASTWPYDKQMNGDEKYDRKAFYSGVWAGVEDTAMVWVARLKISLQNMSPLSAGPKAVGDAIGKSGYFTLDDSINGGA